MSQEQTNQEFECEVCYPKDDEVVRLMYNLRNLILKQHKKIVDTDSFKPVPLQDKNEGAIEKLVKFVFNDKIPIGFSCKHLIVEQFLLLKTKLSRREINFISDSIYQFEAKRNYQIEVLMNQIKCFPKSIIEQIAKKPKQTQPKLKKKESLVKIESTLSLQNQVKDSPQHQGQSLSSGHSGMNIPYYYYPYYIQSIPQASFHGFFNQAM